MAETVLEYGMEQCRTDPCVLRMVANGLNHSYLAVRSHTLPMYPIYQHLDPLPSALHLSIKQGSTGYMAGTVVEYGMEQCRTDPCVFHMIVTDQHHFYLAVRSHTRTTRICPSRHYAIPYSCLYQYLDPLPSAS